MRKIWIAFFIVLGFQMCSLHKVEKPAVKLDMQVDIFLASYKDQLGVKDIHITNRAPYNTNDSLNIVHVLLFNPPKSPEKYPVDLSLEIASKVYEHLLNKNDFEGIDINYVNEKPFYTAHFTNSRDLFSYKEIQAFINKSK